MQKRKLLSYLFLLCMLTMILVPFATVKADDDFALYIADVHTSSASYGIKNTHPSYVAYPYDSANAGWFNTSTNGYLTSITMWLGRYGTLSDVTLVCDVQLCESRYNCMPNGTIVAQATNNISSSELGTTAAEFTFYFNQTAEIEAGVDYVTCLYGYGAELDASHYVIWYYQNSGGEADLFYSGAWQNSHLPKTFSQTVMGNVDVGSGEPTPTPTPDTGGVWTDSDIETFMGFLIPILVIFVPTGLLLYAGRRYGIKSVWIIIIGLAIGTGLGFIVGYVPYWLVLLIAVGIAALAYSEVR